MSLFVSEHTWIKEPFSSNQMALCGGRSMVDRITAPVEMNLTTPLRKKEATKIKVEIAIPRKTASNRPTTKARPTISGTTSHSSFSCFAKRNAVDPENDKR